VDDRLGTIAPGKIANLTVTDGDLFSEKTKVKHVFVDGRWFEIHEEAPAEEPGDGKKDDGPSPLAKRKSSSAEVGR
jgi:adenine deaminase